jgi:hypothetical protein
MSSHDFITFKAKIGIMELGNDAYFFFKLMELYIFETDEIRFKQTHLRRTNFRTNLLWTSLGRVVKTFSKYRNSLGGSVVPLQIQLWK